MAEIKYLRKITILFYRLVPLQIFTTNIYVLIYLFTDVNESMKYGHKTSKRTHSGAAMNCNPRCECY